MKKAAMLGLALCLLLSCTAPAEENVIECRPGEEFSAEFALPGDGAQVTGAMCRLQYDHDLLELVQSGATSGDGVFLFAGTPVSVPFRALKYAPYCETEISLTVLEAWGEAGVIAEQIAIAPVQVWIVSGEQEDKWTCPECGQIGNTRKYCTNCGYNMPEDGNELYQIGKKYDYGDGATQDYQQAFFWYKKSAELGYVLGMTRLGVCYHHGFGTSQDYEKAIYWYQQAVDLGDAEAMNNLGVLYFNGQGVTQDTAYGFNLIQKAAALGEIQAMCNMGNCYLYGMVVEQNNEQALYWYQKSADGGYVHAMYKLGQIYEEGKIIGKDMKKARAWYTKAAEAGHEGAKEKLQELN